MDIYSYGMILFELWHRITPFDNDVEEALRSVLIQHKMPIIQIDPQFCNLDIAKIITDCWKEDPSQRMPFFEICKELSNVKL